jgi:hypothetical protein
VTESTHLLLASARVKPADTLRFTYNHTVVDDATGDRYKEVFVLNPNWRGKLHGIDVKRLTAAEREVLHSIFNPGTVNSRLPLVNDILRRMKPLDEIKNPMSFYQKFVKVFLRKIDAYRTYEPSRMSGVTTVKSSEVRGGVFNAKPLFHKSEAAGDADKAPNVGPNGGVFKKV